MEAIRRQEQRLYEERKAKEQSKEQSLKMGLPSKDRWKPQLFRKDYPNSKQFTGKIDERDFKQMMKTNDRFMSVEEHDHILRMRDDVERARAAAGGEYRTEGGRSP